MNTHETYIYGAIRSPWARDSLIQIKPVNLISNLLRHLEIKYPGVKDETSDIFLGCTFAYDTQGGVLARTAVNLAQWPDRISATTVQKYASSSSEAIRIGAALLASGASQLLIAGGTESPDNVQQNVYAGPQILDVNVGFSNLQVPPVIQADLLATQKDISRDELDEWALKSIKKAKDFQSSFSESAFLNPIYDMNHVLLCDQDELQQNNYTSKDLQELPSIADTEGHVIYDEMAIRGNPELEYIKHLHTAGNSAVQTEGAALLILGTESAQSQIGNKPIAKIAAIVSEGAKNFNWPEAMKLACNNALHKANIDKEEIDHWEVHESFAVAPIHFKKIMDLENHENLINPFGGSIGYGIPEGAIGARMVISALSGFKINSNRHAAVITQDASGMATCIILSNI